MMILEIQDTNNITKNDMVIIKEELCAMSNNNLGWKSEELQSFFINYANIHEKIVERGLNEL